MRAVHPDALPKGVLNVNLKKRTQAMLKPFFFFWLIKSICELLQFLFIFHIQLQSRKLA